MNDSEQTGDRVAEARRELERTLDAIEAKFNVPRRINEALESAKDSYARNPVPWWVGAGIAALAIAGGITALVVSRRD